MEIAYYCVTNKIDSKNNLIQSAHQPNFLPWIGYFAKINQSHVFVFSDDVRYSKQQLTNRANFIDVNGKTFTCTIPVNKTSGSRLFEKTITLAISNERILRPSRPIMRPFISSEGSDTTETELSTTRSPAKR